MKKLTAIVYLVFFLGCIAYAQTGEELVIKTEKKGAFNESADESAEIIEEEIPYYYRQHKKLATFFSGYVIELTTSDLPLRRDYPLFEKFGNVFVCPLKDGGFSYVIKGFKSDKSAKSFLKNIVIHNAPEAKVFQYNKGVRKKVK